MAERKNILLTGGCGYIASHTAVCLLNEGYNLTIVDNFVNSTIESTNRVKVLANIPASDGERIRVFNVDITDKNALEVVFRSSPAFYSCIHFAGLKAVGESVRLPLLYYSKNVAGTLVLLELMEQYSCRNIVFSSSATVYGAAPSPITEQTPVGSGITNPYGKTKFMIEEIIKDFILAKSTFSDKGAEKWSAIILRYFNPVGNHPSGMIG
jgi:UDP-glucose 4-epimerase